MWHLWNATFSTAILLIAPNVFAEQSVQPDTLVSIVENAAPGATIHLPAGTFELSQSLHLKQGMTLIGAGVGKTILTGAADWKPSTETLPDREMEFNKIDDTAYLIRIPNDVINVRVAEMTLTGPNLHGAIFSVACENLQLDHLRIENFLWSGIRTFAMKNAKIVENEFVDAGGRWEKGGLPGIDGGVTGGAIFAVWMSASEIANNRFTRTQMSKEDEFYGIKVRQATQCRVHHNTIEVNFSMEFPFENDEDVEIDHNICFGTVSIPKHAGGSVPESGRTFHIHHNWFRDSYAIEFVRNGIEIDHNLFDFDISKDHGNLISGFGQAPAIGPASFHHNLVSNPGRGVIWMNEPYGDFSIHNNHIITRTTTTPRTEGLFAFHGESDFSKIIIRDNIIECIGQPRPLLRSKESYVATIINNALSNVSDTAVYKNSRTGEAQGLELPLKFRCGLDDEAEVDGFVGKILTSQGASAKELGNSK